MRRSTRILLAVIVTLSVAIGSACGIQPAAAKTTIITLTIGSPTITVNGTPRPIDDSGTMPVIVAGRTLLPIRAIVEAIGGTIAWDATTRTVAITAGAVTMSMTIGNRMATVRGTLLPIDAQNATIVPLIVGGRTMLPVRFVGEQLGGIVAWDDATKTATLTFGGTATGNGDTESSSFDGNIVLGAPTATSIKANVFSPAQSGTISLTYGTASGTYDRQTAATALAAGKPLELTMNELQGDTQYYYRLRFTRSGGTVTTSTDEYEFHTARPEGSTFTFTVQADSHLDENSNLGVYRQTMANVLADAPDFHIDLGDTFMCEKYSVPLMVGKTASSLATVRARYAYERSNFGIATHSVPLFLANGNHEGEIGWLANGTTENLAVWSTLARQEFFLNPTPDGFYSGDSTEEPIVGERASWYSWIWGDALFVVLDPYWNTKTKSNADGWSYTLGERQYQWLQETLYTSVASFKFVFTHSLVGGLDGQIRGGVEAAPYFEWGGDNTDGTWGFAQKRPGWSMPIHQLLVRCGVTAVFHGHDHLYAKQALDGVVYQAVPQPSARDSQNGPSIAKAYHYTAGTILSSSGHLRVTVSPSTVSVEYVRSWLPSDETAQRQNASVDHVWSVEAGTAP